MSSRGRPRTKSQSRPPSSAAVPTLSDNDNLGPMTRARTRANSLPPSQAFGSLGGKEGQGTRRIREYLDCVLVAPEKRKRKIHVPVIEAVDPPLLPDRLSPDPAKPPRKKPRLSSTSPSSTTQVILGNPDIDRLQTGLLTPAPSSDSLSTRAGSVSRVQPRRRKRVKSPISDEAAHANRNTAASKKKGKTAERYRNDRIPTANEFADSDSNRSTAGDAITEDGSDFAMDMDMDLDFVIPDFQMLDISDVGDKEEGPSAACLRSDVAYVIDNMKDALRIESTARQRAERRYAEEVQRRVEAEKALERVASKVRSDRQKKEVRGRNFSRMQQEKEESSIVRQPGDSNVETSVLAGMEAQDLQKTNGLDVKAETKGSNMFGFFSALSDNWNRFLPRSA